MLNGAGLDRNQTTGILVELIVKQWTSPEWTLVCDTFDIDSSLWPDLEALTTIHTLFRADLPSQSPSWVGISLLGFPDLEDVSTCFARVMNAFASQEEPVKIIMLPSDLDH